MKFVPKKIALAVGKQLLKAKKNSPHVFFAVGVVGVVGGTVMACKATLKLEETLDEIKEEIDGVKTDLKDEPSYQKDLAFVYGKGIGRLVKLYGPSVGVGVVSIACLTGSHVSLTKRNKALMAAYAAVSTAFKSYRERVREELGVDKELDIYRNIETRVVTLTEGDKPEQVKVVTDPNKMSPYAKLFDETSANWNKDPELNRYFLDCQQRYANMVLQSRGWILLNDVYDLLDIPRTRAGAVVGWSLHHPDCDKYVDFGLFNAVNGKFLNNWESRIWLDFNVAGVILDYIDDLPNAKELMQYGGDWK